MEADSSVIPDPLIAEWDDPATTPARIIELLGDGADEGKLRAWAKALDGLWGSRAGYSSDVVAPANAGEWLRYLSRETEISIVHSKDAAAFLRCLFPNPAMPREMVECPECGGTGEVPDRDFTDCPWRCEKCLGEKLIPAPFIDPRWRSDSVMDMARVIRGRWIHVAGGFGIREAPNNDPVRYAVLADALMDAGMPEEHEIIRHLQQGVHVAGCFVLDAILSGG